MKKISLLLALLISMPLSASAEEFLYVNSARAKLLSSPFFGSKTLEHMIKGEKVTNLEKKQNWFKVRHNGKVGWLSRLSVAHHPPMKRKRRVAKNDSKLMNDSRRRASAVSTTAAVRGLQNIDRSRVGNNNVMDYVSLERMESLNISDDEVFAFMDDIGN